VTDDAKTPPGSVSGRASGDLRLRVISAAVLAPLAIGAAWLGGWPFLLFWTVAACVIQWEWRSIAVGPPGFGVQVAAAMIGIAGVYAMLGRAEGIGWGLGIGTALEALFSRARWIWAAAGFLYAAALLVACVLLRRDADYGFTAIICLFGIVWATDICGYFVGRAIGGPKLWPAVSPKKTWSGALGGAVGAVAVAVAIASWSYRANPLAVAGLALLLSVASQAGDLFESWVKRRFGVKDASHVIPGHGGVMDRLDGFLAAVVLAAVIGVARGGMAAPARGLLVW
jgi:phosphatidate cytidylyltransferase